MNLQKEDDMWPDIQDVERHLKSFPAPKPNAEQIFADVVLARLFLKEAVHHCFNHGQHCVTPVSDVKKLAEQFIGRTIDKTAFAIAIEIAGLRRKYKSTGLKLPPLQRFGETAEGMSWKEHQADAEKDIAEEIKQSAEFRA